MVLVLILACGLGLTGSASAQSGCPTAAWSDALRLTVERRVDHALIADSTVELQAPARVYVEYGNTQTGWLRTPTSEASSAYWLPLLRLRPETAYQVRAFALNAAGCPAVVAHAEFSSGPLPELLRGYTVRSSGQASFPLAMMDWRVVSPADRRSGPDRARWLAVLDEDGQMVWYYQLPREIDTSSTAVSVGQLANGN